MSLPTARSVGTKGRRGAVTLAIGTLCAVMFLYSGSKAETQMKIVVDATDLPRKLLRSEQTLALPDDTVSLLYPKWIPGIHGPKGPIQNLGGLVIRDLQGNITHWERDWADPYRFSVYPENAPGSQVVSLTYICNQPSTNSMGVDCYGYPGLGIINWNCVLVYPEGVPVRDIVVEVSLVLPSGWQFGTALPLNRLQGDTAFFNPVTLEELIDMPLICGRNFRTVEFAATPMANYFLHIAADDAGRLPNHDSLFVPFARLAQEAEVLFGRTHFETYHLLVVLSDAIPFLGLEHRNSSLNVVNADDFYKESWLESETSYLIPHEFAHAWCGKYRRPAGMDTPDYQTDKRMDLLWIYEGLDTYLGYVLSVRSGFISGDDFKDDLAAYSVGNLMHDRGRRWRPLRDTEVSNYTLRDESDSWGFLRRNQDYYSEGGMIWMDFDARIREATDGQKSLDDFCAAFFSHGDPGAAAIPFDLEEVVSRLADLAEEPWDSLIAAGTQETQDRYVPEVIERCGYRLGFGSEKSALLKVYEDMWFESKHFSESIGFRIRDDGTIEDIVPGGPADMAGLYDGAQVIGVDGMKYSYDRLEYAVRNSPTSGRIDLLTVQGETLREVCIIYDGGLRYYTLIPIEGKRDWLREIISPRTQDQ